MNNARDPAKKLQMRKMLGLPLSKLILTSRKLDCFSSIIAPSKSRKHIPTPIWIREKNGRCLVKIEDTHQEEEFQVRESFQATMAAPISDEIAQKIFKAMEEQSDTLKKMGVPSLS